MKRFCIDDETIMDYLEGRLKLSIRNQVEQHLCDCADCREIVAIGAESLHESEHSPVEPVSPVVTQRAIDAVKTASDKKHNWKRQIITSGNRLFSKGRSMLKDLVPGPVPQPVVLRGGDEDSAGERIRESIKVSDIETVIEIEKTSATHLDITVELTTDNPLETPLRIVLFTEENEIASVTYLDDSVKFEDIPIGKYTIRFLQTGHQLNEYKFEM